jgi:hypothetical protein
MSATSPQLTQRHAGLFWMLLPRKSKNRSSTIKFVQRRHVTAAALRFAIQDV